MTEPNRPPNRKSPAGRLFHSAMMLARRVHLYSGIFMFPFVLLYGFTGWFFNHPGLLTGDRTTDIVVKSDLPSAGETAAQVVDELNYQSLVIEGPEIKLTDDRAPRYSSSLTYNVSTLNQSHVVTVNPTTGQARVRTTYKTTESKREPEQEKANPLADFTRTELEKNLLKQVADAIPPALESAGLESGSVKPSSRLSTIIFSADADGVPCVVTYNLANEAVSSLRADEPLEIENKNFLTRLHVSRHYTPQWDVRWVWALLVDAMFVSMVFWGCSGLFMWWQVKRTRVWGIGVFTVSLVFTAFLAIGMHDIFTSSAPARTKLPTSETH